MPKDEFHSDQPPAPANETGDADRDRVIADTGWGIKPDDQPANANDVGDEDGRVFHYDAEQHAGDADVVRRILQAQRRACNIPNRVMVETTRVLIMDINGDGFRVQGLGYGCEHLVPLLQTIGAAFDPRQLRKVKPDDPDTREYEVHRAWAWGEERPAG